ncbi:MAG: methyltransferase domain-containing protein [Nitrospirales bacterium]|nr:methyltransferase domain-containing protein [Nitrospirales bacterium]
MFDQQHDSPVSMTQPDRLQALSLEGETLQQRAWRMPDIIVYQHNVNEWWVTPLDEELPLIRLNRAGASLLGAMDGRATLQTLLDQFGTWVCSPSGETGRWHLEHWSLPRYSLCFYGAEAPSGHSVHAKWDLLLQRVRDHWPGNAPVESDQHLTEFHHKGIQQHHGHFEIIETTVSHLFREPCEALHGLTYGRLLAKTLRQLGWWNPKPRRIVEVGAGLGYVSREMARELSANEQQGCEYVFLDLTRPFLTSQMQLAREAGWDAHAVHANAEQLPFPDASVDLVIDNENLADMTPTHFKKEEFESWKGATPEHQTVLELIRRLRLPLDQPLPDEIIVNSGAMTFLMELWRVLRPGGRAVLIEFGIETGWPDPVRLPGHTEYEVQFSHLRQTARWLGFREQYCPLPQFLSIQPDTQVLCTGAAYAIRRFCEAEGKPFAVRAYTESELADSLGELLSKLTGLHYHNVLDPAWFSLWDFKALIVEKPGGVQRPAYRESKGFRWYSQH